MTAEQRTAPKFDILRRSQGPTWNTRQFRSFCARRFTSVCRQTSCAHIFQRNWFEYRRGFGSPGYNFWVGLRNLHALTTQRQYTLRIDLYDWDDLRRSAIYRNFYITVS